jgi:hypothetical protein
VGGAVALERPVGEDAWRSRPFGEDEWVKRTASELRLEHTIGSEGRPPKPWLSQPPAGRRSTGLPGKRLE